MSQLRKRRSRTMGLVLLVASSLASLLIAEVAVRQLGLAPEIFAVQQGRFRVSENPLIGYELVPYFESDRSGAMLDFRGKANGLGFRDREHALRKPEGTFRALVLGDSIVQGLGIPDDQSLFTSVLERELDEKHGDRVEVMNFGVSGYNTQQEVETLREKGLPYDPDLVILAYCVNDTWLDSGGILLYLEQEQQEQGVVRGPSVLMKSALFRLIHAYVASREEAEGDLFRQIKSNSVLEYLDVLAELSRRHGFAVLVVYFPRLDGVFDEVHEMDFATLERTAAGHGFHSLNLTEALSACAANGPIAFDPIHPNVEGHRCVGEAIAAYLDGNHLVDQ